MVLALPGGRGLFSTLYTGLTQSDATVPRRIRITKPLRDAITDLQFLAHDLAFRPTRLGEIVDALPAAYGAADASGSGMGGIWLSHDPAFAPILWRCPFPSHIQADLVSFSNPHGHITNSDLELAAQIASLDIIINHADCRERTLSTFTDNISARAWHRKGSRSTLGPAAYLLRLLSLHQRHFRYRSTSDYIAGPANTMADDASRLWHLSDALLLAHFNSSFPQARPWQLSHLRPAMHSALTTALRCNRIEPALFLHVPPPETLIGFDGSSIVNNWTLTQHSPVIHSPSPHSRSSLNAIGTDPLLPAVDLLNLARWKQPSAPSARRFPAWGPKTLV